MTAPESFPRIQRFTSGVPGLDRVLDGGFLRGSVYIVEGHPGAGKTILANQICFHHAKHGDRVLYVTLLAASHARLLQHLQDMTFFDASLIPERLTYVSGFRTLEEWDLKELLDLLRKELRAQRASLVILDGFAAVSESAATDREFTKFVHELQVQAGLAGSTFFLLSSGSSSEGSVQPAHTMVDGLVRLGDRVTGVRAQRELTVQKFRGSRYLRGVHTFDIGDDGIRIHPRLETSSADRAHAPDAATSEKLVIGIPRLDAMVGGGLRLGSTTMILGPTGVGKTSLGYRFLASSSAPQRGLLLSFYETPQRALGKAAGVGLDLATKGELGEVELLWLSPVENSLDAIGETLLARIDAFRAKRLFIDGFNAFVHATSYPERVSQFFGALQRELRARGVTTMYAAELHPIFSPTIEAPVRGISSMLENLLLMRYVESAGELHRLISVLKLRDSDFEPAVREFVLTPRGLDVIAGFPGSEALLTGVPQPARKGAKRAKKRPRTRSHQ